MDVDRDAELLRRSSSKNPVSCLHWFLFVMTGQSLASVLYGEKAGADSKEAAVEKFSDPRRLQQKRHQINVSFRLSSWGIY